MLTVWPESTGRITFMSFRVERLHRLAMARRIAAAMAVSFALLTIVLAASAAGVQDKSGPGKDSKDAKGKVGVVLNEPGACQGYTLLAPLQSTKTYLLDLQ